MAYKALKACGLSCDLIRSEDVRNGRLRDYALLFVPGGWASNKAKALGRDGVDAIRQFVNEGGAYLGFCGGAGLATKEGIGLVPVTRRPTNERVPSFSGRIGLTTSPHPVWQDVSQSVFHAWWPSQFVIDGSVTVLATYGAALPDAFSSDVNVGDAEAGGSWPELERMYKINLGRIACVANPPLSRARLEREGFCCHLFISIRLMIGTVRWFSGICGNTWPPVRKNDCGARRAWRGSEILPNPNSPRRTPGFSLNLRRRLKS
jgi:putative intracellular protease/amidase